MTEFPCNFGPYVLLGELGRGAMGVVYQARHLGLNRPVAIKLLDRRPGAGPSGLRRFLTEAEAAASLDHPHIVPVYEAGEQEGQSFLSMRLLSGGSLAEWIDGKAWTPKAAAVLLGKLARGVAHAHERGVLHRDLKPGNILLDEAGEPCLADFGLAKLRDAAADLTSSQAILGTPAYMAPEVASSGPKAATLAADIYSLGAVLYELLTGRPPFIGDSTLAVLEKVKRETITPPGALNPAVPRDLELICLKCLQREASDRYATAVEVADDCGRFLRGEPVSARAPRLGERLLVWTRQHRLAAGMSGALLLSLVLGLGLTFWQWRRAEAHLLRAESSGAELAASLARGQQRLAETALVSDQPEAGLLELARLLKVNPSNHLAQIRLNAALSQEPFAWPLLPPLRHAEALIQGRFDSLDRWVVTLTHDQQAHLWDSRTGAHLKSFPHRVDTGPLALSGDGNLLATCPDERTVVVWSLPAGECVQSWSNAPAPITALRFRPSSFRLAIGDQAGRVTLYRVDSNEPPQQIEAGEAVRILAFDRRGRLLFTAGLRQSALWELSTGRRMLLDRPVLEPVRLAEFSQVGDRLLTVVGQCVHIWSATNGQHLQELRASAVIRFASFDLTGSWVASGNDTGRARLQSVNLEEDYGLSLRHDAPVNTARFDPLQQMILSASSDGSARLWRARHSLPIAHAIWHRMPVLDARFSYDGQRILTVCADGTAGLWSRPRETHAHVWWQAPAPVRASAATPGGAEMAVAVEDRLLFFSSSDPGPPRREFKSPLDPDRLVFDPGGSRLALTTGRGEVLLLDSQSGRVVWGPIDLRAPIRAARFNSDGRLLAVGTTSNLHVWPVESGLRKPLVSLSHRGGETFAISGDGRRLACLESEGEVHLHENRGSPSLPAKLPHRGRVLRMAFSPDNRILATGGVGCGARLWEAATGRPLTPPLGAGYEVSAIEFSPDSQFLLACSRDGSVRVWRTARPGGGEPVILPHQTAVETAAFSPNGKWIATLDRVNQVRLWDALTGVPLSDPWLAMRGYGVDFTPDGRRLVVRSEQPGFDIWDLPVAPLPAGLLVGMAEMVTGREIQPDGSYRDLSDAGFRSRRSQFSKTFGANAVPPSFHHFHISAPPLERPKPPRQPRTGAGS